MADDEIDLVPAVVVEFTTVVELTIVVDPTIIVDWAVGDNHVGNDVRFMDVMHAQWWISGRGRGRRRMKSYE